jgi:hypothetical protein
MEADEAEIEGFEIAEPAQMEGDQEGDDFALGQGARAIALTPAVQQRWIGSRGGALQKSSTEQNSAVSASSCKMGMGRVSDHLVWRL